MINYLVYVTAYDFAKYTYIVIALNEFKICDFKNIN